MRPGAGRHAVYEMYQQGPRAVLRCYRPATPRVSLLRLSSAQDPTYGPDVPTDAGYLPIVGDLL